MISKITLDDFKIIFGARSCGISPRRCVSKTFDNDSAWWMLFSSAFIWNSINIFCWSLMSFCYFSWKYMSRFYFHQFICSNWLQKSIVSVFTFHCHRAPKTIQRVQKIELIKTNPWTYQFFFESDPWTLFEIGDGKGKRKFHIFL